MKHISVIVPAGECILSSIIGPFKMFNIANSMMAEAGQPPMFRIDLVGLGGKIDLYEGSFSITPTATIHEIDKTDLIVITTINGDIPKEIENNKEFLPWISDQYNKGAEVASLCMGSFLLAATGLLDGKNCTTHWKGADAFKMMFPKAKLLPEKIITDEGGIYTSGGAYSFLNLNIYLIEKYCGREIAIMMAKLMEIDINRYSQNEFAIFTAQKDHDDDPIKDAQLFIENNFSEKISVEDLADKFALSRRNFIRRFKKATHNTPIEYIQRVKIEAAKKSFETSNENVNDVMYAIGYNDQKAFRNIFRKHTGYTPTGYRAKYNRSLLKVG